MWDPRVDVDVTDTRGVVSLVAIVKALVLVLT
jgi:hypothetical protein